ncbi:unnamed protein product [Adineta ricciae]|uniref:Uncharacterized protein n=1 Tax=Adineta ricciae TaxID=249248 RepID=A0A813SHK5_ADIRI|nr:unnamed protein product [Adineta ricciae]CAF0821758.1 unnamed protein product [Adineta ricciae]
MATNCEAIMHTHRRLNIQRKIEENNLTEDHLLKLKLYRHRREMFHHKMNLHGKNSGYVQRDDMDEQQKIIKSNCVMRMKTQLQLLNISTQTQKRLLDQVAIHNKQRTHQLPSITNPSGINEMKNCLERLSLYRRDEKRSQMYLNQQILNEHENQREHNERKMILLKQFDELKHTIEDPHSTLSTLAALSRALLHLESGMK